MKLAHGTSERFLVAISDDLGDAVRIVQLHWTYDHGLDPLDLSKVCVLMLCSDHIFVRGIVVRHSMKERGM